MEDGVGRLDVEGGWNGRMLIDSRGEGLRSRKFEVGGDRRGRWGEPAAGLGWLLMLPVVWCQSPFSPPNYIPQRVRVGNPS